MTNACNLRCTYCYARGGEEQDLWLTFPLAKVAIDAAHENARARGQQHFAISFHGGGEPTLNWEVLTAAVRHALSKDLPCHVSMATNGVWGKGKRDFILANFKGLNVSFDGIEEVQNEQRPLPNGRGSFDLVMESISAMDDVNFQYGIRLTYTPSTFSRLPESIAFLCEGTKCKMMQVEPSFSAVRGDYADPTPDQASAFARAFMEAFEIAARSGRTLFYSGARPWIIASAFCRAPEDSLVVTPEGDVVACFETHDRRHPLTTQFVLGRVSQEGLRMDEKSLFGFAQNQEWRRRDCEGCFCYWHCCGDCATKTVSLPQEERGRCLANRAITRELLAWYIAAGNGLWSSRSGNLAMS